MKSVKNNDRALVEAYRNGEVGAFEKLVLRHKDAVYTAIVLFVNDSYVAEGIFQQTFMDLAEAIREGKLADTEFLSAAMESASSRSKAYMETINRPVTIQNEEGIDVFSLMHFAEKNLERNLEKVKTKARVKGFLNQLKQEEKELIVLRHFAELTFEEIAELTNQDVRTVLTKFHASLNSLRALMDEEIVFT